MVTFRSDTSFPFLALARRCGVPYAEVLRWSETLKVQQKSTLKHIASLSILAEEILKVMDAEHKRRATVAHNAVHTGDAP